MKGPVVLLGPAGAGKSAAGAVAAQALGMRFVDLDDVVGTPAIVFRDEGEASFRVREYIALDTTLDGSDVIVAAGAGVVDTAPARALLAARASCIKLDVDGSTAVQRLRAHSASFAAAARPWLPLDDRAQRVWTERDEPRRRHRASLAHATGADVVDARGGLDDVAVALARTVDTIRPVRLAQPDALFVDGAALAVECARGLAAECGGNAIVIVERRVAELHDVKGDLVLDGGESLKSLARVDELASSLVDLGATRDTLVVAVGGGALLDACGLASALLFRGVRWCAVPTTLLAQVDAGVGGKTAVSLRGKKNLAGAFHAPLRTIVCRAFLDSLDDDELRAGRAEMLKHEFLAADAPLDGTELMSNANASLAEQVRRSLSLKSGVVARDPRERGLRAVLNLGHTLAHALEASTTISHGEAVRHGLLRMIELSVAHASLSSAVAKTLEERVRALGPLQDLDVDARAIEEALRVDKKGAGRWVLLRAPGLPVVTRL